MNALAWHARAGDAVLAAAQRLGTKRLQPFWEYLAHLGHAGMNLGGGADLATSGEAPLLRALPRLHRAVDAGAHAGAWTRLLHQAHPACSVIQIEPAPQLAQRLRNARDARVAAVVDEALSDHDGWAVLHDNHQAASASITYGKGTGTTVPTTTLPSILDAATWAWVDYVKLDLEGGEEPVLRTLQPLLDQGRVRYIQFEHTSATHESGHSLKTMYHQLAPTHDVHRILRNGTLRRLPKWRDAWETPAVTNYLATQRAPWTHTP